jgi:ABC-type uncharacterized transport system permease subunit
MATTLTDVPSLSLMVDLAALLALLPASVLGVRARAVPTRMFWIVQGVALAGALTLVLWRLSVAWDGGLGTAVWLSIAATLIVYYGFAWFRKPAIGLLPLLAPYLLVIAGIATVLDIATSPTVRPGAWSDLPEGWVVVHVVVSLATYALVTIAAIAGLSVLLREASLKTKREDAPLVGMLPALREAESLQFRALVAAEIVLGIGIVTGMVLELVAVGAPLVFNHKTVLSLTAFVVLGLLLIAHAKAGLRGRRAARICLVTYLLLTLAYLGVKAVQQFVAI